ncbi:hypothetical protein SKAU_G00208610 [Synaphobranchus kaupii]|uniref:Uncharacterized protein n=1 Tax=Synaphobranchus kaupii TaxID=118154 RepID=A0A9Q1F8G4_SYNKA|nr:hypothetical protein SKAU_G00208610 [Synaphobranchus kaupii]
MASPLTPDNTFFSTTPSPDGDILPALMPNSPGPQSPWTTMDHAEYLNWCSKHLLRKFISRDPGLHQAAMQWSRTKLEELFQTQRGLLQVLNQPHREELEPSALAGITVMMAYSYQIVLDRERTSEHRTREIQGAHQLIELEQRLQDLCQQGKLDCPGKEPQGTAYNQAPIHDTSGQDVPTQTPPNSDLDAQPTQIGSLPCLEHSTTSTETPANTLHCHPDQPPPYRETHHLGTMRHPTSIRRPHMCIA